MGILQPWHLIVILTIVLIVFGPGKLPDLGASLGKGIRELKRGIQDTPDDEAGVAASRQTRALPGAACAHCGVVSQPGQLVCGACGSSLVPVRKSNRPSGP